MLNAFKSGDLNVLLWNYRLMLDAIVARKADEILEFNTAHIIVTFAHHNTKVESAQHNLVLLF
jgi:hypothetical protein